jgi:bifunctional UDP-N-acetylglucosamine pyrophosphorylase / glucosamine-1-phosphate N-acetyltransferase
MAMGLQIIVLAAGKGQRILSDLPKVLHPLAGKPLLERVVDTARQLNPQAIHVVYGNGGGMVCEVLKHLPVNWVEQAPLLGTGHAVLQALPHCALEDRILILYGDVPLVSLDSLQVLLAKTPIDGVGLMVAELTDPHGFGRIIRDPQGRITAIVEHRDADEHQLTIKEINTGILTAPARYLKKWLPQLKNGNHQKEYYLTDVIALAVNEGLSVYGAKAACSEETRGVNDRLELHALERFYQRRLAMSFMRQGVSIADADRLDIRGEARIEADVFLDINVVLEGRVVIGKHSRIGPNVLLKNVEIGENVEVLANSVIEGAVIGNHCQIGPFARVRPDTVLADGVKIGNFVEVKKSRLGQGSKVPHLSYVGDAMVGCAVNIGAGVITCNYDGANKHATNIGDGAFIGSNTALVAPVSVGPHATIGAGSTITRDAPEEALTVARARQSTIKGWKRRPKTSSA